MYTDLPVDHDLWTKLPDLTEGQMTFDARREGPCRFVQFTVPMLALQDEVRRLWRDLLIAADQILPFRLTHNSTVITHCGELST